MTQDTAAKYYEEFKDKTFVVEVEDGVVDKRKELFRVINDAKTLIEHGIKVVLVYGHGSNHEHQLCRSNGAFRHPDTNRLVVSDNAIPLVESERIRISILIKDLCQALKIDFEDMPLDTVNAERRIGHQASGLVSNINVDDVPELLDQRKLPIFGFGGVDDSGKFLHIPSIHLSAEIAGVLRAQKLMMLNMTGGIAVPTEFGRRRTVKLSFSDLDSLLCLLQKRDKSDNLVITGEMVEKVHASIRALLAGAEQVHIVSHKQMLTEILTRTGAGTMVERHQSHNVDLAKPNELDDIVALHEESLQHTTKNDTPFVKPLDREELRSLIGQTLVLKHRGIIIGKIHGRKIPDVEKAILVGGFAIGEGHQDSQQGETLLREALDRYKSQGFQVACATTASSRAKSVFERVGGELGVKEDWQGEALNETKARFEEDEKDDVEIFVFDL